MLSSADKKEKRCYKKLKWRENFQEEQIGLEAFVHLVMNMEHASIFTAVNAGQETTPWLPQVGETQLKAFYEKWLRKQHSNASKEKWRDSHF